MATRKKAAAKSKPNLFSGIIIGLVLGLGVAVAVALFITQAPMPFMDKVRPEVESILLPDVRHAPDPNQGLYGSSIAADNPIFSGKEAQIADQLGGTASAPPIAPPITPPLSKPDTLGNLIAQLPNPHIEKPASTPTPTPKPAATTTYYLQAGAFRSAPDADTMRARIIMMGLNATVLTGQHQGSPIHRVRVGPYKGLDEMNKARSVLGQEKIETSVVRQ